VTPTLVPEMRLRGDVSMPRLGFGVFQVANDETTAAVLTALECGYRSIDTAALYGNEAGVGAAIATCGIAREDLFVTTKLWNSDHGSTTVREAFERSLTKLGVEYVDLYLIHWPVPSNDKYVETWQAFERLSAEGLIRAIGVSNFTIPHLRRLLAETSTVPSVNQIELHPGFQQVALRDFHADHGIVTEAWSPLGQGAALGHPVVADLARKHGKTPAQIVLRWHIDIGNVVIPKSVTPHRIRENIDVFDFELTADDMRFLKHLDTGRRIGPVPESVGVRASGFSTQIDQAL
jgi:2,5-diketo-D-gluconate reductase A